VRATLRSLLASGPAGLPEAFVQIARDYTKKNFSKRISCPHTLFTNDPVSQETVSTKSLWEQVAVARTLFGIGLGFEALPMLTAIVDATLQLRWMVDSKLEQDLAIIDGDIAQAMQSCREQAPNVTEVQAALNAVKSLKKALLESRDIVGEWGGEFVFDRGLCSTDWDFSRILVQVL
jgi:hypothetical protein